MRGKAVDFRFALCSLLFSALSIFLVKGTVGNSIALIVVPSALFVSATQVVGGAFTSSHKAFSHVFALVFCLSLFMVARIRLVTSLNLGFEAEQVVMVEGRTVYDSSLTSAGNHMMKIMLRGCKTLSGDMAHATGLVTAVGDRVEVISFGTVVRLEGRFSGSLFVYDRLQVLNRGRINALREHLISFLENRMVLTGDPASTLSTLLLLGRSDYAKTPISELAQSCGCAHILALSGMHLGILTSICKKLFGEKLFGKVISFAVVLVFVFVAGPRPSLVRSALAFALGFMDIRLRTLLVFLLQMMLFPMSMTELGCCYGYVAVFAIVFLSPLLKAMLFQWVGRLSDLVSATLSVMVLSAPIQILSSGKWHPAAIIASPVSGLLAAISMVLGLLLLSFGRLGPLVWLNDKTYRALESLFDYFGSWPAFGWGGYATFITSIALLAILSYVVRKTMRGRCKMIFNSFS